MATVLRPFTPGSNGVILSLFLSSEVYLSHGSRCLKFLVLVFFVSMFINGYFVSNLETIIQLTLGKYNLFTAEVQIYGIIWAESCIFLNIKI